MHDLVHDLWISVSKAVCFNEANHPPTTPIPPHLRYVAVQSLGEAPYKITEEGAIYLRTVFLANVVADDMFKNLKSLRVLSLWWAKIEKSTNLIGDLIHLRLLDASHTSITDFPDSICKLLNLQTLGCSLSNLPEQLQLLVSLRHIMIDREDFWSGSKSFVEFQMPLGIGKLTDRRTLPVFKLGLEEGRRIDELGYLNNQQGIEIHNLELVNDKEEAMKANISQKPEHTKSNFFWSGSRKASDDRQLLLQNMDSSTSSCPTSTSSFSNHDTEVLDGLQPHQNIKFLVIVYFMGDSFPAWTMRMIDSEQTSLHNLTWIELLNCERCQQVPTLGHLPLLKTLKIEGLTNLKSIGPSFFYPHDFNESGSTGSGH